MPVKQIRTFNPQVALSVLYGVTTAIGHFLGEAGMEAAHFIEAAFQITGGIRPNLAHDKSRQ